MNPSDALAIAAQQESDANLTHLIGEDGVADLYDMIDTMVSGFVEYSTRYEADAAKEDRDDDDIESPLNILRAVIADVFYAGYLVSAAEEDAKQFTGEEVVLRLDPQERIDFARRLLDDEGVSIRFAG